jgi:hypothetical protein
MQEYYQQLCPLILQSMHVFTSLRINFQAFLSLVDLLRLQCPFSSGEYYRHFNPNTGIPVVVISLFDHEP